MKRFATIVAAGGTLLAGALSVPTAAGAHPSAAHSAYKSARVCAAAAVGYAACASRVRVDGHGNPVANATPGGYGPADIRSAYNLTTQSGAKTVAVVDAYDDPSAAADLATYRSQFGLPACTTANGCFRKVNQTGGTTLPKANTGWSQEIALDVDMVSATCPDCHILLVEATSNSFANLGAAVNYAATQGVAAISNSYGGSDSTQSSAYDHQGIAITASTGDGGYGVESPASYDTVVAVGGTSLSRASNSRGWSESAWSGAGSGCSTKNAKPSWQTSATQCTGKANADVSAVADPNTGVAVYGPTGRRSSGWMVFGGTSASSPIIASVYALGGNLSGNPAQHTWASTANLNDVTTGSNGTCSPSLWCHAGAGWDGPTGLGTPNGVAAF